MPIHKYANVGDRVGIVFGSCESTVGSHFAASSVPSGRVDMNILYVYNFRCYIKRTIVFSTDTTYSWCTLTCLSEPLFEYISRHCRFHEKGYMLYTIL